MRERERRKPFSKAFTLVEMLIVVVLIWILSVAILPRLTNYMAKTRDLKRQADLKNIAAAIEMYSHTYGDFPRISDEQFSEFLVKEEKFRYLWSFSLLEKQLSSYITQIPKDPSSRVMPLNIFTSFNKPGWGNYTSSTFNKLKKKQCKPWEYLWVWLFWKNRKKYNSFLLVAKVETPDYANYVNKYPDKFTFKWGWWGLDSNRNIDISLGKDDARNGLYLCSKITNKVIKWEEMIATKDNDLCSYSSPDQLYYILKLE